MNFLPVAGFLLAILVPPPPKVEGFSLIPSPSIYVEYEGWVEYSAEKIPFRLRSAVISEETRKDIPYYWVEHNFFEKNEKGEEEGSHIKALIKVSDWERYWKNLRTHLKKAEEVWLLTAEGQLRKIMEPAEMEMILPLLGPGFVLFRDFSRALEKKYTEKKEIEVKAGKFQCFLIPFDYALTDQVETDLGIKVLESRYFGLLWVSNEVPFGIVKATYIVQHTTRYEIEGVKVPAHREEMKFEFELVKKGQNASSLLLTAK